MSGVEECVASGKRWNDNRLQQRKNSFLGVTATIGLVYGNSANPMDGSFNGHSPIELMEESQGQMWNPDEWTGRFPRVFLAEPPLKPRYIPFLAMNPPNF